MLMVPVRLWSLARHCALLVLLGASPGHGTTPILHVVNVQPFIFHCLVTVEMNEEGMAYCGALVNAGGGTYTPSVYQMMSGTGLDGHGSTSVQPHVHKHVIVTGLVPATPYDVYCYGEDLMLNGIGTAGIAATRQAGVVTASGGDYVAPVLEYFSPFEVIENTAITVYIRLSEDGTVWCVARQDAVWGTAAPSASQIRDNRDVDSWATKQITAANLYEATVRLGGLLEDTLYRTYCFAEDMSGNGIDGTPALPADPAAIDATRRNVTTLFIRSAARFELMTVAGGSVYHVEPATWNLQLPRQAVSGCQARTDLEAWNAPLLLEDAALLRPGPGLAAWGCAAPVAAPRGGGPFILVLLRGKCGFAEKAARAHRAGYHGLLIVDHQLGAPSDELPDMTALDGDAAIEIPGWLIGKSDGEAVLSAVASSADRVTANVADVRRKPRLGDFQSDEFGSRSYVLQ